MTQIEPSRLPVKALLDSPFLDTSCPPSPRGQALTRAPFLCAEPAVGKGNLHWPTCPHLLAARVHFV